MLDAVKELLHPRNLIVVCKQEQYRKTDLGTAIARIKTALDFHRARSGLKLAALVEKWNGQRINRELY
jgi:hypothetical protein